MSPARGTAPPRRLQAPDHPLAGQLTFNYETMELAADEGLYLIVCGVAPGSRDAEALNLLASWSASASARTTSKN
ncbi:MmyB family transcriptional regulator [Streptomyces avermitilis]|uniref:MmyB family transcriptional regulator n=1 Tax=Streptomyces avermitilis TaxID=33903 RepID=UPI0033DCE32E